MLISAAIVITVPRESGIRTLVVSIILGMIFSAGPEPTLWLLGTLTVSFKLLVNKFINMTAYYPSGSLLKKVGNFSLDEAPRCWVENFIDSTSWSFLDV